MICPLSVSRWTQARDALARVRAAIDTSVNYVYDDRESDVPAAQMSF
jgi:hypothetical protein